MILEAQASGLPVVAVAEGGPPSLIEDRHTGLLCPPDADSLAGAVLQLAASPFLRERISRGALAPVRGALLGARPASSSPRVTRSRSEAPDEPVHGLRGDRCVRHAPVA